MGCREAQLFLLVVWYMCHLPTLFYISRSTKNTGLPWDYYRLNLITCQNLNKLKSCNGNQIYVAGTKNIDTCARYKFRGFKHHERNKNISPTSSLLMTSLNSLWTLFIAMLAILRLFKLMQRQKLANSRCQFIHVSTSPLSRARLQEVTGREHTRRELWVNLETRLYAVCFSEKWKWISGKSNQMNSGKV